MSVATLPRLKELSVDKVYCAARPQDMSYDPTFRPENSIIKKGELTSPGARNLSIVIPPWHAPDWFVRRAAKREQRIGRNVLYYMLNDNILSTNADRTLESFAFVAKHIKDDIEDANAYEVNWVASSLGTSVLMRTVGGEHLRADSITLNAPGGSLAKSLWTGVRTQPLRRQFEAQGVTLDILQDQWEELDPIFQAPNIHGADITMNVSRADRVIRPDTAYELAEALNDNNNLSLYNDGVRHMIGHYGLLLTKG